MDNTIISLFYSISNKIRIYLDRPKRLPNLRERIMMANSKSLHNNREYGRNYLRKWRTENPEKVKQHRENRKKLRLDL